MQNYYTERTEAISRTLPKIYLPSHNPVCEIVFNGDYIPVQIFCDDGTTEIEAYKFVTGSLNAIQLDMQGNVIAEFPTFGDALKKVPALQNEVNPITDCHGQTFTNGTLWIDNDQIEKVIHGDGYKQTSLKGLGTVLVFYEGDQIVHSSSYIDDTHILDKGGIRVSRKLLFVEPFDIGISYDSLRLFRKES